MSDIVYLNDELVAMNLYGYQAGWYFFINDHLGTLQKIVNEAGEVVWAGFYQPFGKAWAYPATVTNNFRFPGQYYDAETGLHYNWNRYYDPESGRYLTADPIGLAGGINLYSYVMNNPINLTDPYGLSTTADVLIGIGWILAAVEPTVAGEALMAYISAVRAGVAAAIAAEMIMEQYGENGEKNICPASDGSSPATPPNDDDPHNKTRHGQEKAEQRGFTDEKIKDIVDNYSHKVYQPGGRTVYAKKNGNYYDVVITNKNGDIISTIGGKTKSLKNWKAVTKMLDNQGGIQFIAVVITQNRRFWNMNEFIRKRF